MVKEKTGAAAAAPLAGEVLQKEPAVDLEGMYLQKITGLEQDIAGLKIELSEAQGIAKDALSKYNTEAVQVSKPLEIEVSGGTAKINFGVHFEGKQYSATELAECPEVVEALIAISSGAITLLED